MCITHTGCDKNTTNHPLHIYVYIMMHTNTSNCRNSSCEKRQNRKSIQNWIFAVDRTRIFGWSEGQHLLEAYGSCGLASLYSKAKTFVMFSRLLRSSSSSNRTKALATNSTTTRIHENNDTHSEETRSFVTESRIVRWRRESVNGNANLIIAG